MTWLATYSSDVYLTALVLAAFVALEWLAPKTNRAFRAPLTAFVAPALLFPRVAAAWRRRGVLREAP